MDALQLELAPPLAPSALLVVAQPSLFREPSSRISQTIPHGATLLELVLETGMGELRDGIVHLPGKVVCTIDGNVIERAYWHRVRPRPGRLVNIYLVPQDQRTAIIVGASLAIGVAAIATGGLAAGLIPGVGGTIFGSFLTAGIAIGGNYLLTALVPLQEENSGTSGPKAPSAVTGDTNPLAKDEFVPVVLANRVRVVPRHWARPFTEAAGDDTYWRMLLVFGQGPLSITQLKAGETLMSSLPDDFDFQIREGRVSDPPITLFTKDVFEINPTDTLGELKGGVENRQVQTTQPGTTEISIDITWPQGIFHQGKQDLDPFTVEYTLELKPTGSGSYTDFVTGGTVQKRHETEDSADFKRKSFRRTGLAAGQYDVRVTRRTIGGPNDHFATFWTALRSIQPNDPRPDRTLACVAIRAKKTGSGTVPVISAICRTYAPDWNGSAWVEGVTGNPASLARLLLQGAQYNPNPIGDVRIDLPSWQEFHEHCEAEGFEFNGVFDDEGTCLERLTTVLAAGRGRLIPPDTKFAVAIDRNGKTISGMITPRNSSDFKGTHFLRDEVQALRVRFVNEDTWQSDERLVFADGFDENTVEDGKIETYDLTKSGITEPDMVWRFGRWRLADMALRLDLYQVTQGIENLQHVPGDLVAFQHHAALLGLKNGRIKGVTLNGSGQVTSCTIDDLVTMEAGHTYAARVRLIGDDGMDQFVVRAVITAPGSDYSLTFSTPFAVGANPAIGDLLAFGETSLQTVNALVKEVIPGPEKTAQILLVDEAPAVNTADEGPIPPFTSQITLPGDFFGLAPAVPVIDSINIRTISHPSQPDLVTQQQVVVHLRAVSSELPPPTGYDLEIKRIDQAIYQRRIHYPPDTVDLAIDSVLSDALYDVRVRATGRSPRGIPNESAWSAVRQIYVPLPDVTFATAIRVTGLELQGQGNDTTFEGPDAHFAWRVMSNSGAFLIHGDTEQHIGFIDPQFAWFEAEVVDPQAPAAPTTTKTLTTHFRFLQAVPANLPTAVANARAVLALANVELVIKSQQTLSAPATYRDIDVDTGEDEELYLLGLEGVADRETVIYFINSITQSGTTFNGWSLIGPRDMGEHAQTCRSLIGANAGAYTLGHELCHQFGLVHITNTDNIMFQNTTQITNLPPDLNGSQITTIRESSVAVAASQRYVRRLATTTTPSFVYSIADNKADSRRQSELLGGSIRPLRTFTLQVCCVDKFGRKGPKQSLTVSNPAPAAPAGLFATGAVASLFVKADLPDDEDFEQMIVYVGAASGFNPAAQSTQVFREGGGTVLSVPQAPGTIVFVRVALADRFSAEVGDLNLSSEFQVPIQAPEGPPIFTPEGIIFRVRASTNVLTWTSGTMHIQEGPTLSQEAVIAGQAQWTVGTLWIYYVRGSGALAATTNPGVAQGDDRRMIAMYRGGKLLTMTGGIMPITNIVTVGQSDALGDGRNSYRTILTCPPITTAGNPVKLEAMLQGSANGDGGGSSGSISITFRFRRSGTVVQTYSAVSASGTTAVRASTGARAYMWRDAPSAGTYTYDIQGQAVFENLDNIDADWRGFVMSAEEALL